MPIQQQPVNALNLIQIKKAIENISRNALSLQNPSGGDNLFISGVPTTNDLDEGQAVFYISGATYRLYFKINNNIRYVTLSV